MLRAPLEFCELFLYVRCGTSNQIIKNKKKYIQKIHSQNILQMTLQCFLFINSIFVVYSSQKRRVKAKLKLTVTIDSKTVYCSRYVTFKLLSFGVDVLQQTGA